MGYNVYAGSLPACPYRTLQRARPSFPFTPSPGSLRYGCVPTMGSPASTPLDPWLMPVCKVLPELVHEIAARAAGYCGADLKVTTRCGPWVAPLFIVRLCRCNLDVCILEYRGQYWRICYMKASYVGYGARRCAQRPRSLPSVRRTPKCMPQKTSWRLMSPRSQWNGATGSRL